jgi:hypothetical protein
MKIDWMTTILAVCAVLVVVSFWRAHNRPGFDFNAFDLITENGRVSKIALAFMLVLAVSTWVIVAQQLAGKLTEGLFGLWLTAWVTPLVAKVVFNKSDPTPDSGTTITTKIESTEKTTP